ncbi:MAG TPA: SDR family oxidoreductase [Pseudomonas xinjiangensis]|uniref:SDR family oxidoreductase n=2 Tax=root TaxID=1 RepID=A0A7V1BN44_9GAMM|nr:SDR family oxidoreductase [Halopseudomonas xinjiangensis]HEC48056.1 SDR family oxidoreductase [Halopseudomonas xinjiangensis]
MKNSGQRVVITGAGSGLGRELALRYAREGGRLALADIQDDGVKETLAMVEQAGGWGFTQRCDVRDFSQLAALAQSCQERMQGVDVLINNAGVSSGGFFWDLTLEDWEWQISINLMGVVKGCKAFIPMFTAQRSGRIVNIASMAALMQAPGMSNYNVAKAGVVALSESLLVELQPLGIKVNVVCPSFFQTNLLDSYRGPDLASKEQVAKLLESSPITAADIADIVFTQSEADRFMILPHESGRQAWAVKQANPQAIYDEMTRLASKKLQVPSS